MPAQISASSGRMSREARRAQLVDAARSIFVAQGFHATAMDEIADAAGVSKPVLYQHFPSKLGLYQAILAESANRMVQMVREAIASSTDNSDRVHRAVAAYFAFIADDGQAYRLIFESDLRDEPEVVAIVDRATDACIDAIRETITADTGADVDTARLLAAGLVGVSQVGARYWLDQSDTLTRARAVELLSTLAWRGISAFPLGEDSRH